MSNVAGPDPHDLVDMARRTHEASGRRVRLVPSWSSIFGPTMAGDVLLPAADALITPTSFDECWRFRGAPGRARRRCSPSRE